VVPRNSDASAGHQILHQDHEVAIVGVGLVELEHGELGVVTRREALVAKDASDLEHLLEAADDETLQVELGRDAQEEVGIEGVVVGHEGLGRGARR
jgi:hypothetical protein